MTGVLKQKMMPAIFFGHGSPMNALENNKYTRSWVNVVRNIPKPKAILVISAHWQTNGVHVTSNKRLKTIHDFYGFPKELHDVRYDVNGSEELVGKIQNLIHEVKPDEYWGVDHGAWSILKHIYPNADIPVVQLSIDSNKTPSQHFILQKNFKH
jgi:4,5-DOPA dioxygenase extradiol